MDWPYAYTSFIWLFLAFSVITTALAIYAWRHRNVPGCTPFFSLATVTVLWILTNAFRQMSIIDETRIFWFKCDAALLPLMVTAELCFVVEYAGLGKWLTRRTLVLLAIVPALYGLLILTNEVHHLVWTRIWFDGYVRTYFGPANWWAVAYGYSLTFLQMALLVGLFVRSPRHRWIAGLLMIIPLITRAGYIFRAGVWSPLAPLPPLNGAVFLAIVAYALALFRFHMFEAVPVARDTIIDRMRDGMMVVNLENAIVDLNRKAETLLGIVRSKAVGGHVDDVLHAFPDLLPLLHDSGATQEEAEFINAGERWVQALISPIIDRRGFHLGRLIWLQDITERRRAQEKVLDQERTLAMLKERELLARELHDGIGQMLAAAQLQAKAAREFLARRDLASVESCLQHLAEATQEAKESVRSYLLGVKAGPSSGGEGLVACLRRWVDGFIRNSGIRTEIVASPELESKQIDLSIKAQLQPIVQEALTNVRRHAGVCSARVILGSSDSRIQVTIEDDGRGFNPGEDSEKHGFGLRSMQGRAEAVGGLLEVDSAPGKGTRVIVRVPCRKESS